VCRKNKRTVLEQQSAVPMTNNGQTAVIGPGTGCTTIISLLTRHSTIVLQDNSRHDLGMDRLLSGDGPSREHRLCVRLDYVRTCRVLYWAGWHRARHCVCVYAVTGQLRAGTTGTYSFCNSILVYALIRGSGMVAPSVYLMQWLANFLGAGPKKKNWWALMIYYETQ